ncbi:MAG: hypothetical protein M1829_000848 [Trizodia sp. TS-e1964]|nr:MAG: hypothetical protein M1829_000848 [Trizodia sp. TS-e1964]
MHLQSTILSCLLALHLVAAATVISPQVLGSWMQKNFDNSYLIFQLAEMDKHFADSSSNEDPQLVPLIEALGVAMKEADPDFQSGGLMTPDTSVKLASCVLALAAYMRPGYVPYTKYTEILRRNIRIWIKLASAAKS